MSARGRPERPRSPVAAHVRHHRSMTTHEEGVAKRWQPSGPLLRGRVPGASDEHSSAEDAHGLISRRNSPKKRRKW